MLIRYFEEVVWRAQLCLKVFSGVIAPVQRTRLRAVVVDPEVVFVASLMSADAPALAAFFQCDFSLLQEEDAQEMKANVRGLKVLACPFIRNKEDKAVTTVGPLPLSFNAGRVAAVTTGHY